MDFDAEYLYRGTTLGWPGTHANRTLPMTCTTTDPLVATLFALECLFHGHAVVQIARKSLVERFIGPPNHFADKELSINLRMKPSDFLEHVSFSIDVDDAREILWSLGFDRVPILIYGKEALDDHLSSDFDGYRLSPEQKRKFNRVAYERLS